MIPRLTSCSLAILASTALLATQAAAAEGKPTMHSEHQHCMSGDRGASMTADKAHKNHGQTGPSAAGAHSSTMPKAKRPMQKNGSECGGRKSQPSAQMKTPSPHASHTKPAPAKPKAPAADKPMAKHDHM